MYSVENESSNWITRNKHHTTLHQELRERFASNWNKQNIPRTADAAIWSELHSLLVDIFACLCSLRSRDCEMANEQIRRNVIKNEWKKLAMVVDRLAVFITFFVTFGMCLYIFLNTEAVWGSDGNWIIQIHNPIYIFHFFNWTTLCLVVFQGFKLTFIIKR